MKVLLRHANIDLYYAGPQHWVGKADAAADLGTIERATELSCDEDFKQMEIFVDKGDASSSMVIPVQARSPHGRLRGECSL